MPYLLNDYLAKVTSEHNQQPNYIATITATIQPLVDVQAALEALPVEFDLDYAIGAQLDAVGVRVNRNRFVDIPFSVYFSLDTAGLGLDQGILYFPFNPTSALQTLPDEPYRTLLRAVVAANNWDGTVAGAYAAWGALFANSGFFILIQDHGDLSMDIVLAGNEPDAVTKALFTTGELDLKPAGVTLRHLLPAAYPAAVGGGFPIFGIDADNTTIGGLDHGYLAVEISQE